MVESAINHELTANSEHTVFILLNPIICPSSHHFHSVIITVTWTSLKCQSIKSWTWNLKLPCEFPNIIPYVRSDILWRMQIFGFPIIQKYKYDVLNFLLVQLFEVCSFKVVFQGSYSQKCFWEFHTWVLDLNYFPSCFPQSYPSQVSFSLSHIPKLFP